MNLELVNCTEEYWEFVRKLRTHPDNKEGFFIQASITPQQQIDYMKEHQWFYKICLCGDVPSGYVGFINNEITYCVAPEFHGNGIGTFMIEEYCPQWGETRALVKVDNIASQKVFEKLGFEKQILYKKIWKK